MDHKILEKAKTNVKGKNLISELLETIGHLSKFPNQREILQADLKAVDQTG